MVICRVSAGFVAATALCLAGLSGAQAQDTGSDAYLPAPPGTPVSAADTPRELLAGVNICYRGGMVPEDMASQAALFGYEAMRPAEIREVAAEAINAPALQAWADGAGEERVRVVTYAAEVNGRPHVICVINARTPQPDASFNVLSLALGAPANELWREEQFGGETQLVGTFTWYWEEDERYIQADYKVREDGAYSRLVVRASVERKFSARNGEG